MSYRSRSARKYARRSGRNFFITLIIIGVILYGTLVWVLPNFVGGVGLITKLFKESKTPQQSAIDNPTLAPPVLNIPYEATNTAQIDITGYSTYGSKVKIYLDHDLIDFVDVKEDGSLKAEGLELGIGTNNIFGKTVDSKDQESLPSKTIKIIYDNDPPSLEVSEPNDNIEIQSDKIKFSGHTEPGATIYINNSQVIVSSEGKFSTDKPLNEGDNDFEIKAIDKASNSYSITRRVIRKP